MGCKVFEPFERPAQYFLSKNLPIRIDLINALSTGLKFVGGETGEGCVWIRKLNLGKEGSRD